MGGPGALVSKKLHVFQLVFHVKGLWAILTVGTSL